MDHYLSRDDLRLGSAHLNLDLGLNATYSGEIGVTVPPLTEGTYYLIVVVDDTWQVLDRRRLNNAKAFAVSVYIPELTPGTSSRISHGAGEFTHYYRLQAQAGANPVVSLLPLALEGLTLSARWNAIPEPGRFDLRARDNRLLIPAPEDGVWYLRVHAPYMATAGDYRLRYETAAVMLEHVSPRRTGVDAQVNLTLDGAGFVGAMGVELVAADGLAVAADQVTVQRYTRLAAGFAPGALTTGVYTVRVTDAQGRTSELTDALEALPFMTVEAGELTSDQIWSGMIRVTGNVTVPNGQTLEILPGSVLEFVGNARLDVAGVLDAQGTLEQPVRFTSARESDPEIDAFHGRWPRCHGDRRSYDLDDQCGPDCRYAECLRRPNGARRSRAGRFSQPERSWATGSDTQRQRRCIAGLDA